MRLIIDMDDSEIVYKDSGELPEEFKAYAFVYGSNSKTYSAIIGFYQPYYDNNKGGVFDGVGGHLCWDEIVAWKCLEKMQVFCIPYVTD